MPLRITMTCRNLRSRPISSAKTNNRNPDLERPSIQRFDIIIACRIRVTLSNCLSIPKSPFTQNYGSYRTQTHGTVISQIKMKHDLRGERQPKMLSHSWRGNVRWGLMDRSGTSDAHSTRPVHDYDERRMLYFVMLVFSCIFLIIQPLVAHGKFVFKYWQYTEE